MLSVAMKRPAALRRGDRVRLVAPASPFDRSRLAKGAMVIERLGFRPVIERGEFGRSGFLAGDDESRARRLGQALLDRDCAAVWCIRGGYGCARLLPHLDWGLLRSRPKLLIGFSDATALLLSLSAPGGFITVHGPVVTQLPRLPRAALSWLVGLLGQPRPAGRVPLGPVKTLVPGRINGFLCGGNLATLTSLLGTPYFPELAGAILLLEDTGEEAYRLDRMFNQLRQSGVLKNVFGVVLGSLYGCKPAGAGRYGARKTLERAVAGLGVPAISGAAFGHQDRNLALPIGALACLDARARTLTLLEPAVQPPAG